MLKKVLVGFGIFSIGIFILWVAIIFPYSSYATKQIEVMKQELIDGIIQREIKLRELYAKANGEEFVQTKAFKQQLQKEKEKFYKYCNNEKASEYKNEHCEITGYTQWDIFGRNPTRTLKYHFDEESQVFFNQIQTYMFREEFSTTHIPRPKNFVDGLLGIYPEKITNWHERFWIEDPNEKEVKSLTQDNLLYLTKVVGYSSEYNFENGSDRPYGYLRGQQELTLGNGEPVMKEELLFIESKSIHYESISLDGKGRHKNVSLNDIKTYIQKKTK